MGVIGGTLGYGLLRTISKNRGHSGSSSLDGQAYAGTSKLNALFGGQFWCEIKDKVVIDFGCGVGIEAVEMARRGAKKVIGIDIQERFLAEARHRAREAGVLDRCTFVTTSEEPADIIVSIDSFEHFADPAAVLRVMRQILKRDGCILASFGPTWYHPLGGHLFSVFPWAHLIFSERAFIRWRSDFKTDGATRFHEVAGGLNKMTIRRFERIVESSPFDFATLDALPIKSLRWLANGATREFTTSVVRCKLVPR